MHDTIDNEITADTIATQVELERDNHHGPILLVEGDSDSLFFNNLIDSKSCRIVVSSGKENAIGAIEILNKEGATGVLCVVDADFHHLGVAALANNENVVISDHHDLEILMIEDSAFDKLVKNFGSDEKVAALLATGLSVRDAIYKSCAIMGAMRLWSIESGNNLNFKKLKNKKYHFIDLRDLACDRDTLITSVKNASEKFNLANDAINNGISDVLNRGYDVRQLCNGHDMCWVISRALRRLIGSLSEETSAPENIEKILRIGYETGNFKLTGLCQSMVAWQARNACTLIPANYL